MVQPEIPPDRTDDMHDHAGRDEAEVAEQIRSLMAQQHFTQERLAKDAGVAPNTVLAAVQGKPLKPGSLRKIMSALGVEPQSQVIALEGVPDDVRVFVEVAMRRLSRMEPATRAVVLNDLYPRLLAEETK